MLSFDAGICLGVQTIQPGYRQAEISVPWNTHHAAIIISVRLATAIEQALEVIHLLIKALLENNLTPNSSFFIKHMHFYKILKLGIHD